MGFADKHLLAGENVVFRTNKHWGVFVAPVLFTIVGVVVAGSAGENGGLMKVGVGILLAGIAYFASIWLSRWCSEFVVTNKRVLMKEGFIRRRSDELLLAKVEGIDVYQEIMGRILGYGRITVGGTGGSKEPFKGIARALDFRHHVQEQIETQRTPVPA